MLMSKHNFNLGESAVKSLTGNFLLVLMLHFKLNIISLENLLFSFVDRR
jgi:hypothetical protein